MDWYPIGTFCASVVHLQGGHIPGWEYYIQPIQTLDVFIVQNTSSHVNPRHWIPYFVLWSHLPCCTHIPATFNQSGIYTISYSPAISNSTLTLASKTPSILILTFIYQCIKFSCHNCSFFFGPRKKFGSFTYPHSPNIYFRATDLSDSFGNGMMSGPQGVTLEQFRGGCERLERSVSYPQLFGFFFFDCCRFPCAVSLVLRASIYRKRWLFIRRGDGSLP